MEVIELWGGIESSHNRVEDKFFDQISRNGHLTRISDLDLFASIGIKKLRYPILWEHVAPQSLDKPDWAWADERLNRLRELNIEPIVGFVHHGSGPRYTSLVSENFAEGLGQYAGMVAERYPWVKYYTPVNEPLTTARFSGLYGFWYPHGQNDTTFIRCLLNELHGTRLAMKAIRKINPEAQLVQTEDLGQTQSTAKLAYQAKFENTRRWLSFDILCGKVNRVHALWDYLRKSGASEAELLSFVNDPMPPDIFGINHYITSERFLDEHLVNYPLHTHGTNGKHKYADVETVRVRGVERVGIKGLLQQTWERYQLPISVTEAHICCTREEQMRWFKEIWDTTASLRKQGIDCRSVTAWALLGSYDWNSLLTQERNFYENGIYDLRGGKPRATAMAPMLKSLSFTGEYKHPLLDTKGWWDREERYEYNVKEEFTYISSLKHQVNHQKDGVPPILITSASGALGKAFERICKIRGLSYKLLCKADLDITNPEAVEEAISKYKPWAIVNTGGYIRIDDAETDSENCYRENSVGPAILAEKCKQYNLKLLTFSSDMVFDGLKEAPYTEEDNPAPRSIYGKSKLQAEQEVLRLLPEALIIRTSALFGIWDEHNFVYRALRAFVSGNTFAAASDVRVSPTYVPDLVHTALNLLIDEEKGIWHLTNKGDYTWSELAALTATIAKIDNYDLQEVSVANLALPAYRPKNAVLASAKADLMPTVEDALYRCIQEIMLNMHQLDKRISKDVNTQQVNTALKASNARAGTK
ncbi:family 1 glycosylhydrolase [Adhaeribacter aquaticus]|uniref:family 1 glycosylhydrolase n=1 Tax=Adhaeribacter aquaticus TaxID=299567 RepID=UPI000426151B|nr:family 1 glycosylhydrolase [Adhaeribacter aquaticus]